jgi:hypothetical protein
MLRVCDWIRITVVLATGFIFLLNAAQAISIHSKKATEASRFLKALSAEESDAQLALLRSYQQIESCKIAFDFIHRTKGSTESTTTEGVLLIASINKNIFKRLFLIDAHGDMLVDYIFHEGPKSKVWKRLGSQSVFTLLNENEIFSPLYQGIPFRPVDVLMPYIHWKNYTYEGPQAYGVRSVVHNYRFGAENQSHFLSQGISAVRVSIDSKYNSARKIEYLNNSEVLNQLKISGVKKFENLWIISRLVLKEKNNTTIFRVKEASVLLEDNRSLLFDPSVQKKISKRLFFD